jgi:hypothetical protein
MSKFKIHPGTAVLLLIIVVIAGLRLASFSGIGPFVLFSPMGALALFGGAYLKGKITPILFPLLTLFISDVIVSFTIFPELRTGLLYAGWFWTYSAFALIALAGKLIIRRVNVKNIVLGVLAATLIHWLVSDIGMCTIENRFSFGLYLQKLGTAISYELKFLAGTAISSAIMFGCFEYLVRKLPSLQFHMQRSH